MAKKSKKQKKTKPPIKHKPKIKKGKIIKKKFFPVESEITATKIQLYSTSADELQGKTIKLDLTKSLRGRAFELTLKIKKEKDKLISVPEKLQLFQSYVKRIVRKGTDYVEDSFEIDCRDKKLRIKPLLVTRKRVSRSILNNLRNQARKHISSHVKIRTTKEVFSEITANKIQKPLSIKLKKIYPLVLCEIRAIKVIGDAEKKGKEEEKKEDQPKEKAK